MTNSKMKKEIPEHAAPISLIVKQISWSLWSWRLMQHKKQTKQRKHNKKMNRVTVKKYVENTD